MTRRTAIHPALVAALAMALAAAGCERGQPSGAPSQLDTAAAPGLPPPDPEPEGPVDLEDVSEVQSGYVVGISHASSAARYPALAAALKDYADGARAELMDAVEARASDGSLDSSAAMYDLSLAFTEVLDTPNVVAYAADGSTYTGGAHGMPLVARFVWLPPQRRMLTAERLVPEPGGWADIARYVREQLNQELVARVDGIGAEAEERERLLRTGSRMIEEGTDPDAASFASFEPLAGSGGRLAGLRFIFPPYQVAPYSEGVQQVEVPAPVLLPGVAPELRVLFEGGASGDAAAVRPGAVAAENR